MSDVDTPANKVVGNGPLLSNPSKFYPPSLLFLAYIMPLFEVNHINLMYGLITVPAVAIISIVTLMYLQYI